MVHSCTVLEASSYVLLTIQHPWHRLHCRDILNHRYFDKRKLYLAALSKGLADECSGSASKRLDGVSLAAFKGDSRKPILVLTAPFKLQGSEVTMRLIPVVRVTMMMIMIMIVMA